MRIRGMMERLIIRAPKAGHNSTHRAQLSSDESPSSTVLGLGFRFRVLGAARNLETEFWCRFVTESHSHCQCSTVMEARCKKPEKVQREIRLKSVQKPEAPPHPPKSWKFFFGTRRLSFNRGQSGLWPRERGAVI